MKLRAILGLIFLLSILSACSSMRTTTGTAEEQLKEPAVGLSYYMPKKDFLITIKNKKNEAGNHIYTAEIGVTASYPDLSKRYVANFEPNLIGENIDLARV